jgi:hypothetical protein
MSEEDLEVLITLDDPEGAPEEDTFNHHPTGSLNLDRAHGAGPCEEFKFVYQAK